MSDYTFPILALAALAALAMLIRAAGRRSRGLGRFRGKYVVKEILTKNEASKFPAVKRAAENLGLQLFAKVRLADIIEPDPWDRSLFGRIAQKHVDFLVCNSAMKPVCVIEIDDSSHLQKDRRARDAFVDAILKDCKIPTIRKTAVNSGELEAEIKEIMGSKPRKF